MTSVAAVPRLSGGAFTRSRSGSQANSSHRSSGTLAQTPRASTVLQNAAVNNAVSAASASAPILREGYIMFYDNPAAEWQRIYMTLTHSTMSMQSTCSKFGRFIRPTAQLKNVAHFYCSLDVPNAPDRHIPILGVQTDRDELFIFRTPEKRSLMDWCLHLREACPSIAWSPVEEMSGLRSHFSPQLYGTLFRPDLTAKGLVRTPACAIAVTAADGSNNQPAALRGGLNRRSSLSAGAPRRGPARRNGNGMASVAAQMAMARHVDPSTHHQVAVTTDAIEPSPAQPAVILPTANVSALSNNTSAINAGRGGSSTSALCPDAKKAMIQSLLNNSAPIAVRSSTSPTNNHANDENAASPSALTAKFVPTVSLTSAVPQQALNTAQPAAAKPLTDPIPTALEKQLQSKIKDLRGELDAVSGRNIDLEIDNANIGARVLELEAEMVTMKDSIAEWRRRYQSLEQQMACQEENYKCRLTDERESLVRNMREEVEAQLSGLKQRFAERETQLEDRIAELTAKESTA